MNHRIKVLHLFVLIVILASLDISKVNISELFQRQVKAEDKGVYACLGNALPMEAYILFYSQADGTLDYTRYSDQYVNAQYELVPRTLVAYKQGPVIFKDFQWFIVMVPPADELAAMLKQQFLEVSQRCDKHIVLRRIP